MDVADIFIASRDGSPCSEKEVVICSSSHDGDFIADIQTAAKIMAFHLKRGKKTALFCKTRKIAELATQATRDLLDVDPNSQLKNVSNLLCCYRGGYDSATRRYVLFFDVVLFEG